MYSVGCIMDPISKTRSKPGLPVVSPPVVAGRIVIPLCQCTLTLDHSTLCCNTVAVVCTTVCTVLCLLCGAYAHSYLLCYMYVCMSVALDCWKQFALKQFCNALECTIL